MLSIKKIIKLAKRNPVFIENTLRHLFKAEFRFTKRELFDIIIFDDIFPYRFGDWRNREFLAYLSRFQKASKVITARLDNNKGELPSAYVRIFVKIEPDLDDIIKKVETLTNDVTRLRAIAEAGCQKIRDLYNAPNQILRRIKILDALLINHCYTN